MFLLDWYRQWLELRREYKSTEPKICESCETLKLELAHLHQDNQRLLDRILTPPVTPSVERVIDNVTPILPKRGVPWNARRQMLEANDRHAAQLLKNAPKPQPASSGTTTNTTTNELEDDVLDKELKDAEQERETRTK